MKKNFNRIILALPNSGSESLKKVLNEKSNINVEQHYNDFTLERYKYSSFSSKVFMKLQYEIAKLLLREGIWSKHKNTHFTEEYRFLRNFHSDICEFDLKLFNKIISFLDKNKNVILKQHYPPTEKNKLFFKNFKKVILIRATNNALNKYYVRFKKLENENLLDYYILNLKNDIDNWKKGWIYEPNSLIINHEDLILKPLLYLKQIENFLEIKINLSSDFKFPKINPSK